MIILESLLKIKVERLASDFYIFAFSLINLLFLRDMTGCDLPTSDISLDI